ncbi:hypothetical protein ACFLT5_04380, partial [Chloroflexota bacterium]
PMPVSVLSRCLYRCYPDACIGAIPMPVSVLSRCLYRCYPDACIGAIPMRFPEAGLPLAFGSDGGDGWSEAGRRTPASLQEAPAFETSRMRSTLTRPTP